MTIKELQPILDTMDKKSDYLYMKKRFSIWVNGDLVILGNVDTTYLGSLKHINEITINEYTGRIDIKLTDSSITFWR